MERAAPMPPPPAPAPSQRTPAQMQAQQHPQPPRVPFTYTDPRTQYPHTVNSQYSDLRVANDASVEADVFVRGGIHCHMVAQIAAASAATAPVAHNWAAAHPDVPYLDPRGVNAAHLAAFILARLDFLTPEEAFTKRTGYAVAPARGGRTAS